TPEEADAIIVRTGAPFDPRDEYMLEASFRAGSLEYSPEFIDQLRAFSAHAPVILVVHLDRPAILEPLLPFAGALVAEFGASDAAVLDVLMGRRSASGELPFDIPRTTAAIERARVDVPGDTASPLFVAGQPKIGR